MSVEIKVVKPKDNAPLRKKRVAAYARVSVDKDASEHSLENQMEVYREYISSRPEWEFQGVYSDDAFTGTNTSRPGFQEMLKDSYSGKVDIILANFTVTPERAQEVDFALPYMNVALGIVSPEDAPITSLDQIGAD